jgi:pimeloyl-ACP methyl ester carboxylesterase
MFGAIFERLSGEYHLAAPDYPGFGHSDWPKYDPSFDLGEPDRYRMEAPSARVHILDAGHFALDTKADEIAALVGSFMASSS